MLGASHPHRAPIRKYYLFATSNKSAMRDAISEQVYYNIRTKLLQYEMQHQEKETNATKNIAVAIS
jgi:hypothetical protein